MITFEELEALGFDKAHAVVCLMVASDKNHISDPDVHKWVVKHACEIVMWHTKGAKR